MEKRGLESILGGFESIGRILSSETRFKKLQEEVNRCVADMEQGNYHTKEELMKRYGLE